MGKRMNTVAMLGHLPCNLVFDCFKRHLGLEFLSEFPSCLFFYIG